MAVMELHEIFGVHPPVLVASAAGSVSKLAIDKDSPPARAASGVIVGFFFAAYFTPVACVNKWYTIGDSLQLPVAFVLGLTGTVVMAKVFKWVQGVEVASILDRFLRRDKDKDKDDKKAGPP